MNNGKVKITARGFNAGLGEAFETHIRNGLGKILNMHAEQIVTIDVVVIHASRERPPEKMTLSAHLRRGQDLIFEEKGNNLYVVATALMGKFARHLADTKGEKVHPADMETRFHVMELDEFPVQA